jgi:NhaA family Na+:H+ antiporter
VRHSLRRNRIAGLEQKGADAGMAAPLPWVSVTVLRSERFAAAMLLIAAATGLCVANSPVGPAVLRLAQVHLGVSPIDLSVTHWVSDGLLAVFFFAVSVELQYELTRGELRSARRAIQPAISAAGGVLVPIALYLVLTAGRGVAEGWPTPTATDVAFALGVLAVFGRGLPPAVRAFLLALAILDDLVGIVIIAVLAAHGLQLGMLVLVLLAVVLFGVLSRRLDGRMRVLAAVAMVVLAVMAWTFTLLGGIHPTIAGVLLGLAMAQRPALRVRHALEPWINGAILPIFAFVAALVPIPAGGSTPSPAFWGILIALPVGKFVGIAGAGWISQRTIGRGRSRAEGRAGGSADDGEALALGDLTAVGALGGIGFTVSLLLANLAFGDRVGVRNEAILGVLAGSAVALVAGAALVAWRARVYRRAGTGSSTASPAAKDPETETS